MMPRISVVVPTFKRPELLRRCLDALCAQTLPPDDYEIIVADDEASDATRGLVAAYTSPTKTVVRYVAVTGSHGPAAARNAGSRAARAALIAFTDDDCIPAPGWLAAGLRGMETELKPLCASGVIVMPLNPTPTDYEANAAALTKAEFVTANCFCRRDILLALDGFDERFRLAWREDSDLHFRLLRWACQTRHPCPHVRLNNAVVLHPIRPGTWGVSLTQQRRNLFNALLFKKHPGLYRTRIQAHPPWRYYISLIALLTGAVAAGMSNLPLALLAIGAWMALTVRFCFVRLRGTSKAPAHLLEMLVTSMLIPPLAIYWRLRGALEYRVMFL